MQISKEEFADCLEMADNAYRTKKLHSDAVRRREV